MADIRTGTTLVHGSRLTRRTAALGVCVALHGCTFVGAGIGSAIPKYGHEREAPSEIRTSNGRVTEDPRRDTPRREVGSHAWEGAAIGFAIDIAVVMVATVAVVGENPEQHSHTTGRRLERFLVLDVSPTRATLASSRGMQSLRRARAVGCVACLALHGCTLIGAGVGSAIPRYVPGDTRSLRLSDGRVTEKLPGDPRKESYALQGAAVGLALDVTAIVLAVTAVNMSQAWSDSAWGKEGW